MTEPSNAHNKLNTILYNMQPYINNKKSNRVWAMLWER